MSSFDTKNNEPPEPTNSGFNNPKVKDALMVCNDWVQEYQEEMWVRDILTRESDNSLTDINSPIGNNIYPKTTSKTHSSRNSAFKLTTQVLFSVKESVAEQLGLHDFVFRGGQVDEKGRILAQLAFQSFLEKAGYDDVMSDVDRFVGVGDQFWSWYWNPEHVQNEKGFPVKIKSSGIGSLFFPSYATSLRNYDDDRIADKFVRCIFRGQWEQADRLFPWIRKNGGTSGKIPTNKQDWTFERQRYRRTQRDEYKLTEVFEFVDPVNRISFEFAGRTAVMNDEKSGENFPYTGVNDEPILPIYQRKLLRLNMGILGVGVYQAAYRIAVIDRALQNIGITYEMTNLNQIKIVSINPDEETEESMRQKHKEALQAQLRGKEGVIFSRGIANVGNLHTPPLIQELFGMIDLMEKNLARIGFPIHLLLTDPGKTLGATKIEIENQSRRLRYIQRRNAPEVQQFLNDLLAWIAKNLDEDDNTPLNISANLVNSIGKPVEVNGKPIIDERGQRTVAQFTVGDMVKSQKINGFYIHVNPRSGITNPQIFQRELSQQKYQMMLELGSATGAAQAAQEMFAYDGINFDTSFLQNAQAMEQGQAAPEAQNQIAQLAGSL